MWSKTYSCTCTDHHPAHDRHKQSLSDGRERQLQFGPRKLQTCHRLALLAVPRRRAQAHKTSPLTCHRIPSARTSTAVMTMLHNTSTELCVRKQDEALYCCRPLARCDSCPAPGCNRCRGPPAGHPYMRGRKCGRHPTLCRTYGQASIVPIDEMKSRSGCSIRQASTILLLQLQLCLAFQPHDRMTPHATHLAAKDALPGRTCVTIRQQDKHNHGLHRGLLCGLHS